MKKFIILLFLIIPIQIVSAGNFTIDDSTMECIYENGYSVIYDGSKIYLSDSGSEATNANSSISVTHKYLLGGTDWLKSEVFTFSGTNFKCPQYLYESQILNGNSNDETKSYSKYFFAANSRPTKSKQYKYLSNFSLQVMKDAGWMWDGLLLSRPFSGDAGDTYYYYTDCGTDPGDDQKNCTISTLMDKNNEFKNSLQFEDLVGVGYASNNPLGEILMGWWPQAYYFFGYSSDGTGYLQGFIDNQTVITGKSELKREKIFIEESRNPKFTCNYMSEATQAISSKSYLTYEKYDNNMILLSGNFGTTSGANINYTNLNTATNYDECPNTIYVKSPYSTINYDQENPTQDFNSIRYVINANKSSDFIKMEKLADGTYICKNINNTYYDDFGNEVDETTYEQKCGMGIDVCEEYLPKTTQYLKEIIGWLTFLVPVFVLLLISIDFVKCIIANSNDFEDKHKRKLKHIKTRIFILVLFLLLRPLINIALTVLYNNGIIEVSNIDCLFF